VGLVLHGWGWYDGTRSQEKPRLHNYFTNWRIEMLNTNLNKNHATKSTAELSNLVDEFATLHQQMTELKPTIERYEKLKKQLSSEANTFGNGEVRLQGNIGYAVFTKPAVKRTLTSISAFMNAVGLVEFLNCVSVSITKADKLLNESQKAVMFEESIGSRRLKDSSLYTEVINGAIASVGESNQTHH